MSTRACAVLYTMETTRTKTGKEKTKAKRIVKLYRHCDGYPEGLWIDLLEWLKTCDDDSRLLECLGKMEYPPEFTTGFHADIEYLYKVYAWMMSHKNDKKPIKITFMPVSMRDKTHKQMKDLEAPNHPDEKDVLEYLIEKKDKPTNEYYTQEDKQVEADILKEYGIA